MATNADTWIGVVTPRLLRRLAGERYFDRGEAYFADGAVTSLRPDDSGIKATVQGTRRYRVHLWVEDGELGHHCTCPIGYEGGFCKHCVAAGLAWYASGETSAGIQDPSIPSDGGVRGYLLELDKETLVSLLLEQADEDERLYRKLTLRAAQARPGGADPSVWKETLDAALEVDDYVHYHGAYDYAGGIEEVIESLEDLLQGGQAESVIGLAEYGLDAIEESLEHVDDSDGYMGGLLQRLQELHLEACRVARPDPVDLAERLFDAEMDSDYDIFHGAALVYADLLGETGLAAYRRLAEADWATIPALAPGDEDLNRYGRRFRITSIMEALARASEDFDGLIAVKSRDLSSPYAFLQIAELYRDRGDADGALDWAERGWRAFPGRQRDERIRTFIADAYQARGRHDEAMALIWEAFAEYPCLETYLQLKRHGGRAGMWPGWRNKALALIRERIADGEAEPPGPQLWARAPSRDHSLLVEIFLAEGDPATAWREAQAGGCAEGLWLKLAKTRERSHPEDAVRIYKTRVAALLRDTGDRVYQEAVGFLERIKTLLDRSGAAAGFRPYLTEVRATHRRKRNLMKMLDRKGWGTGGWAGSSETLIAGHTAWATPRTTGTRPISRNGSGGRTNGPSRQPALRSRIVCCFVSTGTFAGRPTP
ncbi:MAG: hypothetical protein QNJ30_02255 [Kiloniellales bacterium]|nr:hypothetical protein [Kiloniellales bacterium]